ncbi:MAG: hypothetical protein WD399_03125 [Thermoleophilaceae bacterium]
MVDLQEGARRLGHLDPHPLGARGVVGAQLVLDRVIEDLREQANYHLNRALRQRPARLPVGMGGLATGSDDARDLLAVGEQLGAEASAVGIGDLGDRDAREERQQVLGEPPEVVVGAGRSERAVADLARALALQPLRSVLVEGRAAGVTRRLDRLALIAGEDVGDGDAGPKLGEDVVQLAPGALRRPPLVVAPEDDTVALALVAEPATNAHAAV